MNDHATPEALATEQRSDATRDIDRMPVEDALVLLAAESRRAFDAFSAAAPDLAPIVRAVVSALRSGGAVHYFGAGTSGRLAALDAAEIPPTFGFDASRFVAHLAGGPSAMLQAAEDAEDDAGAGAHEGARLTERDVAIGVTASGQTPYVLGALEAAAERGAFTALLECNGVPASVDCHVVLRSGPEAIAGSTRLNAATAQKLALNAVSTLAMVGLGRTYSNLMVFVRPTNEKLRRRYVRMIGEIADATPDRVATALAAADGDGRVALTMLARGVGADGARELLAAGGSLRELLDRSEG